MTTQFDCSLLLSVAADVVIFFFVDISGLEQSEGDATRDPGNIPMTSHRRETRKQKLHFTGKCASCRHCADIARLHGESRILAVIRAELEQVNVFPESGNFSSPSVKLERAGPGLSWQVER